MKFDVVLGNPPYNRGIDLDFVNLGFDLCTKYCVMITPAKWQTAKADQTVASKIINYGQFREKLVPHMSKVAFYPDASDIFDIRIYGGISYFIIEKDSKQNKCEVLNKSRLQKRFNNTEERSIRKGEILNNTGQEMVEYLDRYTKISEFETNGRYQVWITDTYDSSSNGLCMFGRDGNTGVLCPSRIIDSKHEKNTIGTARLLFASDSRVECQNMISWLYTKFTRFFILLAVDGFHIGGNMHYYRFVPAPPETKSGNPWDHIYTDEELYKAFNLPQKYIDVIEAVIKERK